MNDSYWKFTQLKFSNIKSF